MPLRAGSRAPGPWRARTRAGVAAIMRRAAARVYGRRKWEWMLSLHIYLDKYIESRVRGKDAAGARVGFGTRYGNRY